ncbi:hypothetical protein HYH02_008560 [Chlamydomonas schloesseri]|uniref:Nuclear envelope membrane protein n=1 Tax=Chlamydomonas schloesseri TaxID=2026947 RepID=A0A836B3T5_9CHLO|nr:hypothetical protein HYH02_008560 [Chlamydomonas schloesseri]|eukprot:KAG2446573.1 hypothetical protein HYH02_008560 [Chlamydomonas schloesseri]
MLRQIFAMVAWGWAACAMVAMSCWVVDLPALLPHSLSTLLPLSINAPSPIARVGGTAWQAAAWDCCLFLGLAAQHNIMARRRVKQAMRRVAGVPYCLERSVFVLAAGVALAAVVLLWQPLPLTVWQVPAPWSYALTALALAGFGIIYSSASAIESADLLGLQRAFAGAQEEPARHEGPGLVVKSWYQYVRHPIYLGYLLFLFSTPHMSAGRLLYASLNLAFVLWSLPLEEGDIAEELGKPYEAYCHAVPALIPALRPYTVRHGQGGAEGPSGDAQAKKVG